MEGRGTVHSFMMIMTDNLIISIEFLANCYRITTKTNALLIFKFYFSAKYSRNEKLPYTLTGIEGLK